MERNPHFHKPDFFQFFVFHPILSFLIRQGALQVLPFKASLSQGAFVDT